MNSRKALKKNDVLEQFDMMGLYPIISEFIEKGIPISEPLSKTVKNRRFDISNSFGNEETACKSAYEFRTVNIAQQEANF